jgi:threonine dehydrogenase-like Zn-dependent dehydrogenase
MKALTFHGEHDVRVEDVAKPSITDPTDALVRVTLGALCGSDLHIYELRTPVNEGAVLGHEFVGVVEEVGPGVRRFKAGDRVVAAFFTACGACPLCRRGWFSQCMEKGTFGHGDLWGGLGGGQAEYCVVPMADQSMEPVPDGMSDDQAIFVGDILATGYFGALRAEIEPGDTVAVIGAGPVGLMAVQCAQLFGPARVFAVDMVEDRLELAQEFGAIPIDARATHAAEYIKSNTDTDGADSSIECVGALPSIETAIHSVRGGGVVSMVGVPNAVRPEFPVMSVWLKDLTFRGGWCNVQAHMRPLLALIEAGKLQPERIISHRMPLDAGPEAYAMFARREATKVVFTP